MSPRSLEPGKRCWPLGQPRGSGRAWRWGVWPPFLLNWYKEHHCEAALAGAHTGLVLGLCLSFFPLLTRHEGED